MLVQLKNLATSLLAIGIDNVVTSVVVSVGDGAKFPTLSGNQWFALVVVDAGGNTEIMRATGRSSDTITVIRGQEGTVARAFTAGARVELRLSAESLNSEIAILEKKTEGYIARTVTGGTLDLSSDTFNETMLEFNGVLTSDLTITVPARAKRFTVLNKTAGAFFMLMKTPSGGAVCIPQDTEKLITSDSVNLFRADRHEVGEIKAFGTTSAPSGTFNCDGASKSRTLTPDLFGKIGTTFGTPSGSTFSLPDLVTNNRFLRAAGGSLAVGTTQSDTVGPHGHTASSTFSGTISLNTPAGSVSVGTPSGTVAINGQNTGVITSDSPTGPFSTPAGGTAWGPLNGATLSATFTGNSLSASFTGSAQSGSVSGTVGTTVANNTGTTETRPHNAVVLFCIRY